MKIYIYDINYTDIRIFYIINIDNNKDKKSIIIIYIISFIKHFKTLNIKNISLFFK